MPASAPTKKKGLSFVTGGRMRSASYTVRPAVPERDPLTGRQINVRPALRAVFKEHRFNSALAQEANRWSDDERIAVERHLLQHPDFGRGDGRGIFLDKSATLPQEIPDYLQDVTEAEETTTAVAPVYTGARCEWMDDEGNQTIQCADPAVSEDGFCERHAALVAAASSTEE